MTGNPRAAPAPPDARAPSGVAYRPDLDGLRAVAVLAVVGYHALPNLVPGGFVGVDVFFVISGFLISAILYSENERGTYRLAKFYERRVRRIFPALIVVLAATAALGWMLLFPGEFRSLGRHLMGGAGFASNFVSMREVDYFATRAEYKPLLHLWSLGVEEQYYAAWPLLVALLWPKPTRLAVLIATVGVASLAGGIRYATHPYAFFLPLTRLWELFSGCALAWAVRVPRAPGLQRWNTLGHPAFAAAWRQWACAAGLLLILGSIMVLDAQHPFPGWRALFPVLGAVLVIAAGPHGWFAREVLARPAMTAIGRISYPLYLWHWPLLSFGRIVSSGAPPAWLVLVLLGAAFVLAALTYALAEGPVRFGRFRGPRTAWSLSLAMAAILALGLAIDRDWLQPRLDSARIRQLEAAYKEWAYPGGTPQQPLVLGEGSPRVAFIGDSHMEHYFPRVANLAERTTSMHAAWFMTRGGCPPIPGLERFDPGYNCPEFVASALRQVRERDIATVVFSAYWEQYLMDASVPGGASALLFDAEFGRAAAVTPDTMQLALDRFEAMVASLTREGRTVVVILSSPTSPSFSPMSWMPDRISGVPVAGAHVVSASEFHRAVAPISARMRAIAGRTSARLVDPTEYFCDSVTDLCPGFRETRDGFEPLYSDDNHFRPFYAAERSTFLDPLLVDLPPRVIGNTRQNRASPFEIHR